MHSTCPRFEETRQKIFREVAIANPMFIDMPGIDKLTYAERVNVRCLKSRNLYFNYNFYALITIVNLIEVTNKPRRAGCLAVRNVIYYVYSIVTLVAKINK
jgi:hypothetical protein